jgi:hypothetical protein
VKTKILSAENKCEQIQFNEKMRKYRKNILKNIVKYNLLGLFVFYVTILWQTRGYINIAKLQNKKKNYIRSTIKDLSEKLFF